jgi:Pregnancy-associated plasma protein-A/Secretion system C-terminal sorting domain
MKQLSLLAFVIFYSFTINAQQQHCGTETVTQQWAQQHPEAYKSFLDKHEALAPIIQATTATTDKKTRATTYTIPVVVHIIHAYGAEYISDAQVLDAIRILNEDYNKKNSDTSVVVSPFTNLIANVGFKLVLARKDPNGVCTNGINRIYSYKTGLANDFSKLNGWDPTKYFNIWVIRDFEDNGVAAYAYLPTSIGGGGGVPSMYDGIIALYNNFGSIGAAAGGYARTMTHEFGHSFNLLHTWGVGNAPGITCGSDFVFDTPTTKGSTSTCNLNLSTCTTGIKENVQNYMDYSFCGRMFTPGQATKMINAITSNTAGRGTLVSTASLNAAGVLLPVQDCAPEADFSANRYFMCKSGNTATTVNLTNRTYRDTATTFAWSITNSTSNAATTANVNTVQFTQSGWQTIGLTAGSNMGSSTKTKTNVIYVSDNTVLNTNNSGQSFEDSTSASYWPTFNIYNNALKYTTINAGINGGNCLKLNTYDTRMPSATQQIETYQGDVDELISPAYNLTGCAGCNVSFYTSSAINSAAIGDPKDVLLLQYSTNCGGTWKTIGTIADTSNLFNRGTAFLAAERVPSDFSHWVSRVYPIPAAAQTSAVYFKWKYTASDVGANFYIDNINIGSWALPLKPLLKNNVGLNIYPNPANNGTSTFQVVPRTTTHITIADITGKIIKEINSTTINNNKGEVTVDATTLNGLYLVTLFENGVAVTSKKWIVQ